MNQMADALLKANLVSTKQVEKADLEKQKEKERKEKRRKVKEWEYRVSKNRFGKIPTYICWILAGKIPKNHDEKCHYCGRKGVNVSKTANPEDFIGQGNSGFLEALDLSILVKMVIRGQSDALLLTFDPNISNLGIAPLICRDCIEFRKK